MGSFVGHVLPGSLFVCFSAWWMCALLAGHFRSGRRRELHRTNAAVDRLAARPVDFRHHRNNALEGLLIVGATFYRAASARLQLIRLHTVRPTCTQVILLPLAILGEYYTGLRDGRPTAPENVQHIAMYLFFLLVGLVQLLDFHQCSPLPAASALLYALAFLVEALLMLFHLHAQHAFDQHLHRLLALASVACAVGSLLEHLHPHSLVAQLVRPLFAMLQGVWFFHIAFTSYYPANVSPLQLLRLRPMHQPPVSAQHSTHAEHHVQATASGMDHIASVLPGYSENEQIMVTTAYFCGYLALDLLLLFGIALVARDLRTKCRETSKSTVQYQPLRDDPV